MSKVLKSLFEAIKAYGAMILFVASIVASVCCFCYGNGFQIVCGIINLVGTIIVLAVAIVEKLKDN